MDSKKINQVKLASLLGSSRQVIASYLAGRTRPDAEMLFNIAQALQVSSDYLLGFTPFETADFGLRGACELTGLNEDSIQNLWRITQLLDENETKSKIINCFFSHNRLSDIVGDISSACFAPDMGRVYGYMTVNKGDTVCSVPVMDLGKYYFTQSAQNTLLEVINEIVEKYDMGPKGFIDAMNHPEVTFKGFELKDE